jgi:uncharacterized protein YndB with AHSA1/START domain
MTTSKTTTTTNGRDLILERVIDAPPARVFKAWTTPALMQQWFAPRPWAISRVETDVRTGGSSLVVMRSPEGNEFPCPGVYLEVVENERIVFTDAYTKDWEPSGKPFMTVTLTFQDLGNGQTKYTAKASHWSVEDREAHEKMGFHGGWALCAEQLAELVEGQADQAQAA